MRAEVMPLADRGTVAVSEDLDSVADLLRQRGYSVVPLTRV